MTERLATLLHRDADALDVPVPDAAGIIATGRRQRIRHRVATGGLGLVLASGLLATGLVLVQGGSPSDGLPVASDEQLAGWAVASGSQVQLGTGETVEVPDAARSLYYTSAGVLVRTGETAALDEPESTYVLIDEDGDVSEFGLDLDDRVPGTDPAQPYLAYAEPTDDPKRWDVVVVDVRTGEVEQTIPVSGASTWNGWAAPPVALSGSQVYVGLNRATLEIDLATAEVTESRFLPPARMPTVQGGREVVEQDNGVQVVVDVATGAELLRLEHSRKDWEKQQDRMLSLSPDGRFAVASPWRTCTQGGTCEWELPTVVVHDLATGGQQEFDVTGAGFGWTPQGDLLLATDSAVDVCDAVSGECRSTPIEVDGRNVRLGGTSYEL